MKYKLTKEEFEALDDTLREQYKEEGSDYVLNLEGHEPIINNAIDSFKQSDEFKKLIASKKPDSNTGNTGDNAINSNSNTGNTGNNAIKKSDDIVKALTGQVEEMEKKLIAMQKKEFRSKVRENVLSIASKKIREEAIDDLILHINNTEFVDVEGKILTKDGKPINDWTNSLIESRPLWVGKNVSSSAVGGEKTKTDDISAKKKKLEKLLKTENMSIKERQEASKLAKEIKNG